MAETGLKPVILRVDNVAPESERAQIFQFLNEPGWSFGWKSSSKTDAYSFWHKHFVGPIQLSQSIDESTGLTIDYSSELQDKFPLIFSLWSRMREKAFKGHALVRCYANSLPYGCYGTVHTDAVSPRSFTTVYYPQDSWNVNWGGETVLFDANVSDIIATILPKPNRAVMFQGTIPHVARGVSRECPVPRITLMFKSEIRPQ